MRPPLWHPPIDLSTAEQAIIKRIRRAKLFVFLRQHRHELFCATFQQELAALYTDRPQGQPPVPPAQLALATILQAYSGVSDDEGIDATTLDRRWQVGLDCLDSETPPFSKAPLGAFRHRLRAQQMDRRRLERTVGPIAFEPALSPPSAPVPLSPPSAADVRTRLPPRLAPCKRPAALPSPPSLQSQRSSGGLHGGPAGTRARLGSGARSRGVGAGGRVAREHGTGWTHAARGKGRLHFLGAAGKAANLGGCKSLSRQLLDSDG